MMAGLALLLVSLWLRAEGRKNAWALYPSFFMIITTIAALVYLAYTNFEKLFDPGVAALETQGTIAAILIGVIAVVLIVAAVFLIWDGIVALRRPRREEAAETA